MRGPGIEPGSLRFCFSQGKGKIPKPWFCDWQRNILTTILPTHKIRNYAGYLKV